MIPKHLLPRTPKEPPPRGAMNRGEGTTMMENRQEMAVSKWLTVKDAAARLGVTLARVYRLIEQGRLRVMAQDGRKWVLAEDIKKYRRYRDWWNGDDRWKSFSGQASVPDATRDMIRLVTEPKTAGASTPDT